MILISPNRGKIKFRDVVVINNRVYRIPYDIDWMNVQTTEENMGPLVGIASAVIAVALAPFSLGFSLVIFYIAYRLSKREVGTIELQFTDGLYLRGFTEDESELRFASKHAVGPRVHLGEEEEHESKKRAPVLKLIK